MLTKCQINKLQKIQNKCFRLIMGEEATLSNYHNHGMLNIPDMILLMNLKHGHRVQHSHLPTRILRCSRYDSKNKSLEKLHRYPTQHKNSLNVPRSNCSVYRKSYLYQSIVKYQKLPTSLKEISYEKLFISRCKKLIFLGMLSS